MWQPCIGPVEGIFVCKKVDTITLHVLIILLRVLHVLLVLKTLILFSLFLPHSCHLYTIPFFLYVFTLNYNVIVFSSHEDSNLVIS